jgi:hypothetical protein
MSHGKRWTVDIDWLDDDENEATTTYHSGFAGEASCTDVVNVVASAVAKLCKATYQARIIETRVNINCLDCGYESSDDDPIEYRTYLCKCKN